MRRIRRGDTVVVIAGKDKGKTGGVLKLVGKSYVLVENANIVKRHTRANPQKGQAGGIIEREAPIHVSNVALFNAVTSAADRVGFRFLEDGKKIRYFKSNSESVDA
jgi:large subunit ribosomal protein L24